MANGRVCASDEWVRPVRIKCATSGWASERIAESGERRAGVRERPAFSERCERAYVCG